MDRILCLFIPAVSLGTLFVYPWLSADKSVKTMFIYYTNISNLITGVYFLMLYMYRFGGAGIFSFTEYAPLSFSVTMMISVTFLVFHFVLVPYGIKNRKIINEMNINIAQSVLLHYVVPVSAVGYWYLYADKAATDGIYAFLWLGIPFVYFLFVMHRSANGIIAGTSSRFPYPFMDIDRIGRKKCAGNVFLMFAAFAALSALMRHIR